VAVGGVLGDRAAGVAAFDEKREPGRPGE